MAKQRWSWVKKTVVFLAIFALVIVLIILLMPFWFSLALGPLLKSQGITYSKFERESYTHFLLKDLRFSRKGTSFEAKEFETLFPTALLWRKAFQRAQNDENWLVVTDWKLQLSKTDQKSRQKGVYEEINTAQKALTEVQIWIPKALLMIGRVQTGQKEFKIVVAEWENGKLRAKGELPAPISQRAEVVLDLQKDHPWQARFKIPRYDFCGEIEIIRKADRSKLDVQGSIYWLTNQAIVRASFPSGKKRPETAEIRAERISIPSGLLNLPDYEDLHGGLIANWTNGQFSIDLSLKAEPRINATNSSIGKLQAAVLVTGNTNEIQIQRAEVFAPWLTARLGETVLLNYAGHMLSESANFVLSANLDNQNWWPVKGKLTGEAQLTRDENSFPTVRFRLSGKDLIEQHLKIERTSVEGQLHWPKLEVAQVNLDLGNGTVAQGSGSADLKKHSVSKVAFQLSSPSNAPWMPTNYTYSGLHARAAAEGPWKAPVISGNLEVKRLATPFLKPLAVTSQWQTNHFQIQLSPEPGSTVSMEGNLTLSSTNKTIRLKEFTLEQKENKLKLAGPAGLHFQKDTNAAHWAAQITPLRLSDDVHEISVSAGLLWPVEGQFRVILKEFDPNLIQPFLKRPLPPLILPNLLLAGSWTNGPITMRLSGTARTTPAFLPQFPCTAEIAISADPSGIYLQNLSVDTRDAQLAKGSGFMPVTFWPSQGHKALHIDNDKPLRLDLTTTPNPVFWEQVTAKLPVHVQNPSLRLTLRGSVSKPEGALNLELDNAKVRWATNQPPLHIGELRAQMEFARQEMTLYELRFEIEGQPVSASGSTPLPQRMADWHELLAWTNATAELSVENAQIAAFSSMATNFIAPQGELSLILSANKGILSGQMTISGAATKPLGTTGRLQDFSGRLELVGDQVQIASATGLFNGAPVSLSGYLNWKKKEPTTKLPLFELFLTGKNVPVTRTSDVILRTDLALLLSNLKGGPPLLSGVAALQKSYYLSDLQLLVPPKLATPKSRPPYFSIDNPKVANWRLDINVQGDHFLKIQSPFFNGSVSADFKLGGTMEAPIALGNARVDSGNIQFPFANLAVQQGEVAVTSANPYRPIVFVTATTRAYSYDIRMQANGPADNLKLEFSSTPALSSQQILLMLTTGELPPSQSSLTGQQRTGRIALFVGKNFLSRIGVLSGDEQKLTIRSGESLAQPDIEAYSLEYKLNDEWSLIGDYDSFGGLNVGAKWRFFSE